jgi:outer membrane protein assembly factor BamB
MVARSTLGGCLVLVLLGIAAGCGSSPVACGDSSPRYSTILALDPLDGHVVWHTDVPDVRGIAPSQTSGEVRFIKSGSNDLVRLESTTGNTLGTIRNQEQVSVDLTEVPAVTFGEMAVNRASDDQGSFMFGTNTVTGRRAWMTRLPRSGGGTRVIAADGLAVASSSDKFLGCA